jgi:hypothetical protein
MMIFIVTIVSKCATPPPVDVNELGAKITNITFGSGWDSVKNQVTGVNTSFPAGTKIVYYEIRFEKSFEAGGMVKKKWRRDGNQFLEVTSFIPKNTKRICGEIHYYNTNQSMDTGIYEITVLCYSAKQKDYVEYDYCGANRMFRIE